MSQIAVTQAVLPALRAGHGRIVFISSVVKTDMWGGMLDDHDAMTAKLSDEIRDLYASHLTGSRKLLGRMQKPAADPKRVTKAVEHALTSSRPRRRYVLDTASRVQKLVVGMTPTAVTDRVLAAATTA